MTSKANLLCTAVLGLIVLVGGGGIAFADDDAAARAQFKKGIELYDKKQYSDALAAFREAYHSKPSAVIRQNIALSLKGLNRPADAASSFDEALEEGKGTLKPDTALAIERELAELTKVIATVNITVMTEDKKAVAAAVISIEPAGEPARPLKPDAIKRPIRLMPGIYTFSAHVPGYPDPPEKKFALVSGAPVDATFIVSERGQLSPGIPGQQGTLIVKASRADATIRVDGIEVGRGTWSATVAAGPHHIEASAAGWKTSTSDVDVAAGGSVDVPIAMIAAAEAPGEYMAPVHHPPERKRYYVVASGDLEGGSYRLTTALGEPAGGVRRNFGGLGLSGRFGVAFERHVAVELYGGFGVASAKYHLHPNDAVETETGLFHWQLTPVLRFMSPGKVRFTTATGLGLYGIAMNEKYPTSATATGTTERKGSGVAFSWLFDIGAQFEVGPVFFEAVVFLDVHGVGPVRDDDAPNDRFLASSPGVRGGLRLGLGIPF
jgi:hypothetical protein